ncbi:hypothetical protein, conserved [Eimeria praecox]|uniref:Uncharacterized protein n=1 Tax=Eimeria praecox TaxID=51316 RepID=U6G434_9EIME|nr:hypothetical protein, conserved [Eimeria praecox]
MEAKQKLEKEVTDLKEQLAAREELQKAYEALQKENESLQAKLNAVKSPEKSTGLRPAGDKPVGKTQTAVSEANQPNAPAELQADVEVLKAKAAAAEALEKDIRRLQEQLRASEELRAAHEALEKETEALKEQLRELQSKAGQQKDLEETKSAGKGQLLTASEIEAVLQERNELRERVRDLEKEVAAAAGSAAQPSAMPLTTKKAVEQKGPGKSLPSDSKPPPPLPRRGQASSAKPAAVALPAGEEAGKPSPEETGEVVSKVGGVLSPAAKIANGEQEPGATKTFVGGKGPPPKKLESSLGKKPLPPKAGKELLLSKKAEGSEGPAEPLRKSTKKAPPPPPKPAENDTKVPPPPKKAPPVVSTSGDRVELNGESASNLEQEIASLRERLAAAEGLKKTHESLQKEFEALQEELKALKTQAKASGTEEKAQTSEAEILEPQETEQLRKERNTLRERVAALEAELSTLRAAGAQVVTIPKTKGSLPSKVKPGKPPLPAKVPTQAISTAKDVLISGAAGDGKDEGPVISAGAEAAKEETHHEAKLGSPSMKGVALEGRLNKESLLTEEVLSKSDAETEEGDSEGESSPAEERVAELTERLYRAKRRVRNLVIKCNALVEMEKEREALRNQLESLKAKHEANIKLHEKEAKDKPAMTVVDKAEDSATMLKPASAVTLPSSAVASTVADDLEGMSTMKTGLTTQSSSALLDVRPPADWAAKYEKLKAQRDKVYQAYKAQKERITSLEEEEAITKERLEKLERLYRDTKEELDIATRPPQQVEETESTGILSWLGGGAHEAKNPEEQKLRARVELLQQRLQKALAENDALSSKLAQLRTTPTGSPRGEASVGDEATTRGPQRRASEHLLPDAAVKEAGHASFAKAPPTTPPGPVSGEGTEGNSLAELQEQIKQKDAQIKEYKAEILELKASAAPVSDAASVAAELAKKQEELQTKASELEKVTEEALKKETLIREKTKEIESLKARLESLEKEKLQVLSDNSALKKELERVQKELEALKAETSGPPPTKEKPKPQPSGGANSSPGKAVQRAPSIAKRMPGLPPPPASKVDRPGTAAVSAGATREEQQAADQKPTKTAVAGPTGDQLKKPSQHLKGRDENDEDPSHSEASGTETVSKKKLKKKTAESDGDSKPSKSPEEDDGGAKKKKKKKKKGETSEERSAQHSEVENAAEAVGETTATADAPTGWGFGLFGNNQGTNDASKGDTAAKDASSSAPRPSLLGMIVGGDRAEETPKENEVPPLKLSTVEGAEDQSDDSSSDDGETDGGIASTIAGFFWGI